MDKTFNSLDSQLFDWEEWATEGPMSMQFSNVVLKTKIGDYEAGSKFPFAFLLGDMSLIVLVDDKHEEHGFRLNVSVGEKVDPSELQEDHDAACGCGHEH